MLGLKYNLTLSVTKLRTRRVRLIVTLLVSGIIFTVLVFFSLVVTGATRSLKAFTSEGLLNHYVTMVAGNPFGAQGLLSDNKTIAHAEDLDAIRVAAEQKEAKRLGVSFDPKTASHAVVQPGSPNGASGAKVLDPSNPAARQAIIDLDKDTPLTLAKTAAAPYHPTAAYESFWIANASAYGTQMGLAPIINGKEQEQSPDQGGYGVRDSIINFQNELTAFSSPLIKPFVLEGTALDTKPGDPIPILAPVDAAEKLLGLPALSRKATPAEKIARLAELRSRSKNLTFEACFRNSTALDLQSQAKEQASEIAARKSDPNYQKPALIYGQPSGACVPTPVASDKRSADEKALADKQLQFDQEFGKPKPVTARIKFKIVGIQPQPGTLQQAQGLESAFTSLFTSTLGEGWFMPLEAVSKDPILGPIATDPFAEVAGIRQSYIDFGSRADQKRFIDAKGCTQSGVSAPDCSGGRLYLQPFGNPLAALDDAAPQLNRARNIALGVIAVLAAIVMMGTVGKIIADSRKETSVFRAVGAKRIDIAQIYLLYTLMLATLAFLVAVAIGAGFALFIELRYSSDISAQAVLAFNTQDLHKSFHLIGLNLLDFSEIYLYVIAISLVSAGIPLLSALKRSPIKDMREE